MALLNLQGCPYVSCTTARSAWVLFPVPQGWLQPVSPGDTKVPPESGLQHRSRASNPSWRKPQSPAAVRAREIGVQYQSHPSTYTAEIQAATKGVLTIVFAATLNVTTAGKEKIGAKEGKKE